MNPSERAAWQEWVRDVRETTLRGIAQSAYVMQLCPPQDGEPDVRFAVEIGLSILLDKPIIAVVPRGRTLPPKLGLVADVVVELDGDIDTEDGRRELADKLLAVLHRLEGES